MPSIDAIIQDILDDNFDLASAEVPPRATALADDRVGVLVTGAGVLYNDFKEQLMLGAHVLTGAYRFKLMTAYTPNIDTHQVWSDISAAESSGTGYTAGGVASAAGAVTQDNTNDRAYWTTTTPITFTSISVGTPSHAVIVHPGASATDATAKLVGHIEIGIATNGGNLNINMGSPGWIVLT